MKVIERVIERRIREKVKIDAMQFGFTPGKGTTDAVFTVRQCKRNMGVKESNSTLLLLIWKKHLIEYLERSLDGL